MDATLYVHVDVGLKKKLKMLAVSKDKTIKELIKIAIEELLEKK